MNLLIGKNKEMQLVFDIEKYADDIKKHVKSLIIKESTNSNIIMDSFKQALSTYNSSQMGDFISHLNLCITKAGSLVDKEDLNRREIEHYIKQLAKFKISLISLSKNRLSIEEKEIVKDIIAYIKNDFELKKRMFKERKLPVNSLISEGVSPSFLRKNEKYIVAMILLEMYNYESLHYLMSKRKQI